MLASTNHRDFNNAMNKAAATQGVMYSQPWELGVQDGAEFMNNSYHTVGKIFAQQLLQNPQESVLHDYRGNLSDLQKGLLQHMASTSTMHEFDKSLHACIRHNVMSNGAASLFCKHEQMLPQQARPSQPNLDHETLRNLMSASMPSPPPIVGEELQARSSAQTTSPLRAISPLRVTSPVQPLSPVQPTSPLRAVRQKDTTMTDAALPEPSPSPAKRLSLNRRNKNEANLTLMPKRKKAKN